MYRNERLRRIWKNYGSILMQSTSKMLTKPSFYKKPIKFWDKVKVQTMRFRRRVGRGGSWKWLQRIRRSLKVSTYHRLSKIPTLITLIFKFSNHLFLRIFLRFQHTSVKQMRFMTTVLESLHFWSNFLFYLFKAIWIFDD